MTPELTALVLAAFLQVIQIALYSVAGQRQVGTRAALRPRDEGIVLEGRAGRLERAMDNHFEGLILFTIAVVVVTYADRSGATTAVCAGVYLLARILYIPAYVFGWAPWRSLIWMAGLCATLAMLLAALL